MNSLSKKNQLILVLILLCAVAGLAMAVISYMEDDVPPVISYPAKSITLTEAELKMIHEGDYDCLLADVTVTDNVDGEINDRVVVTRFDEHQDCSYGVAVYAAMDSNDNVSVVKRTIYLNEITEYKLK